MDQQKKKWHADETKINVNILQGKPVLYLYLVYIYNLKMLKYVVLLSIRKESIDMIKIQLYVQQQKKWVWSYKNRIKQLHDSFRIFYIPIKIQDFKQYFDEILSQCLNDVTVQLASDSNSPSNRYV
ncbi:unnamed protein product [Paramecium sonneborni]|uniref:Uncharacterized protein n=1 Tax=Paramecium sonneborni TaxID=65129 RepID=A0A8S1RT42_9CILI|nr:unnamed protein product [Paramecium sonneborni]